MVDFESYQTFSSGTAMRILVVEDHQETRDVLTRLLSRWGFDTVPADTLEHGLNHLATEPIDVILSDIALPDGTGYALISEARRRGKEVLAIALSGYTYPCEVQVAKLTGFDHHLSKPCDCHHLRSLLEAKSDRQPSMANS
jgi:CheY-like chemotaxis protein